MIQNKKDDVELKQLKTTLKERIKVVQKTIKGIEKNSFRFNYDGEQTYNDEVEYQSDLSYYNGKLDELYGMIGLLPKPTKKAVVRLDYDVEGSGTVYNTFSFKLDEETKDEVTYIYCVEDSYCNEETITFTKSEIKETLKEYESDELSDIISMMIENEI